jgi:DNA-binding NarL/FixJ family response regulator
MDRLRVAVRASDEVSAAGVTSWLSTEPSLAVLPADTAGSPDVAVAIADRITFRALARLRHDADVAPAPTVLIIDGLAADDILTVIEYHVAAVLPRATLTAARLVQSVLTVGSGGGLMSHDLIGALLGRIRWLQQEILAPHGLNTMGIKPREAEVLRLLADGLDTEAVAAALGVAERTVANVLQAVIRRLGLRNRQQVIGYALRQGVI